MTTRFRSFALTFALAFLFAEKCPGQAIIESRDWTNADGKKMRAELLAFGKEIEQGKVRFRLKGGKVFVLDHDLLSREDQAVVLIEIFERLFRTKFSERLQAHFFYSKKIPADAQDDSTVAYIGNDIEGGWMRLKATVPLAKATDGSALLFVRQGAESIRIPLEEEDMELDRTIAWLDLSLSDEAEGLATLFEVPSKAKILLESNGGKYSEIPLSQREKAGLGEVTRAFRTLANLTTDHVWWTRFQGMSEAEFAKIQKSKEEPPEPTKPVTQKAEEPILASQTWVIEKDEESFAAEVMGFDRQRVKFRTADGKTRMHSLTELTPAGRETLAVQRLALSLYRTWHPYEDSFAWHWPKEWTDPNQRITKQALLFAIQRETGEPRLFLQLRLNSSDPPKVSKCLLTGKSLPIQLEFPIESKTLKLRSSGETRWWFPLPEEFVEILLVASPALDGLQFELHSASEKLQGGAFSAEEFSGSLEALEIFRAWQSLLGEKDETDRGDELTDSEPKPEAETPEEVEEPTATPPE